MNIRTLAIVVGTAMLTACAQQYWVKAGATSTDFARDDYFCERDALAAYPKRVYSPGTAMPIAPGVGVDLQVLADINSRKAMRKLCLRAQGWRLVTKP